MTKKLNNFEVFSSSRWFPCKWRTRAQKRHRLSLYGYLVFFSYVRQLIVWFLSRGSCKTSFLHPIGTSFSKAANTVQFVTCRTSTLCSFFLGCKTVWRQFCWENLSNCQVVIGAHRFGPIQQGIVLVCVKISQPSVFYIFQNEAKSQIHFCCTFQFVEKLIKFLVHGCFVESFNCVIEYFVSRSFKFRIHQEMLTGTQLFSQPVILNISHNVFHIHISCSWSDLHCVLSVSMLR